MGLLESGFGRHTTPTLLSRQTPTPEARWNFGRWENDVFRIILVRLQVVPEITGMQVLPTINSFDNYIVLDGVYITSGYG
jgi:hypothetical protein